MLNSHLVLFQGVAVYSNRSSISWLFTVHTALTSRQLHLPNCRQIGMCLD